MSHPQTVKALASGRVLIIQNGARQQQQQLGLLLKVVTNSKNEKKFTTLLLTQKTCEEMQNEVTHSKQTGEAHIMDHFNVDLISEADLFLPEDGCSHTVVDLVPDNIIGVTEKTIKVAADKVIDDFNKRKMPRFR